MQVEPRTTDDTAIVIITYDSEDCLQKLLLGLDCGGDRRLRVYWIDNGSSAPSLAAYEKLLNAMSVSYEVKKMWRAENLGYASAVNFALQHVTEAYTLLVNPDVEVSGGWIRYIRAALEKTGAQLGSSLALRPDGCRDQNVARFPGLTKNLLGSTFAPKSIDAIAEYYLDFSCIMFKTDFLRHHLPLRQFFLYGEDVDFMKRVRCHKPAIVYDTSITYIHNRSTSSALEGASLRKAQRIIYADALLGCENANFMYRLAFIFTALIGSFLRVIVFPFNRKKRLFLNEWLLQTRKICSGNIFRENMHVD